MSGYQEIITPSEIKEVLDPLVDSLSQLVLCTITGNLIEVQAHSIGMVTATHKIVDIAQKVAVQSEDETLIVEITEAINAIATNVDGFVNSFVIIVKDKNNIEAAKKFAEASKIVGDAINTLVIITDETSQRRMTTLVKNAIQSMKNLEKTLGKYPQQGSVNSASKDCQEMNQKLVEVSGRAAMVTTHAQKKNLLSTGSDEIRECTPQVIAAAKNIYDNPNNQTLRNRFQELSAKLSEAYKLIVNAVKLETDHRVQGLYDTLDYITKLLEDAKHLQKHANALVDAIIKDNKNVIKTESPKTKEYVQAVAQQAKIAYEREKDSIRKAFLGKAIDDLTKYNDQLQLAAQNTIKQGNNAKNKQDGMIGHAGVVAATQRLVLGTNKNAMEEYPIHISTEALSAAARQVYDKALNGDLTGLLDAAKTMVAVASRAHQDLLSKAEAATDPSDKAKYLKSADELKNSSMVLIQSAKAYAQSPTQPNKTALETAYRNVENAIANARDNEATPPGFGPLPIFEQDYSAEAFSELDFVHDPQDSPLVRAAKEEARAALEILREAELAAGSDAELRRRIAEAGADVKLWSKRVVDAARKAAANPNDPKAQEELANAQRELGKAIHKLVALTKGSADVSKALSLLDISIKDSGKEEVDALSLQIKAFLTESDKAIQFIQSTFGGTLSAQKLLESSRKLFDSAKELSKILKQLSQSVNDDSFKDQLDTCSKIINDKALQLKILATVKSSEGGDSGGQVKSAANGLATQIEGVKDSVRALALRFKVKNTQKQTMILKQIASLVRRGRTGGLNSTR